VAELVQAAKAAFDVCAQALDAIAWVPVTSNPRTRKSGNHIHITLESYACPVKLSLVFITVAPFFGVKVFTNTFFCISPA
jgi:hypothetical protein